MSVACSPSDRSLSAREGGFPLCLLPAGVHPPFDLRGAAPRQAGGAAFPSLGPAVLHSALRSLRPGLRAAVAACLRRFPPPQYDNREALAAEQEQQDAAGAGDGGGGGGGGCLLPEDDDDEFEI